MIVFIAGYAVGAVSVFFILGFGRFLHESDSDMTIAQQQNEISSLRLRIAKLERDDNDTIDSLTGERVAV